jgi:hypothetical protein
MVMCFSTGVEDRNLIGWLYSLGTLNTDTDFIYGWKNGFSH